MTAAAKGHDPRRWSVLLAIGTVSFMAALDSSIVVTILPVVARSFGAPMEALQWVVTVFLLVVSGLMLTFGRLGDLHGHARVFLSGFGLFIAASGLCGVAPGLGFLVAARGLQGLGAAMIFANGAAILARNFPASERGRALGLQAAMTYTGLTFGPSLGGWLADALSWRAVFYVNLPVGGIAWLVSLKLLPKDAPEGKREAFDPAGAALYIGGLVPLLLALNRGHEWGWRSAPILALLGTAALLLAAFFVQERRARAPMLDLGLFRDRTFSASTFSAVLNYIAVYTITFQLPFYLIETRGWSPSQAGLLLSTQPIVMVLAAPLAGALSDRTDPRWISAAGMAVLALGLLALATLGPSSGAAHVVFGLAVSGLGTGTFIAPNNSALLGAAPPGRQGIASGILATARNAGMMLGVALSGAVFSTILGWRGAGADGLFAATSATFAAGGAAAAIGAFTSLLRTR